MRALVTVLACGVLLAACGAEPPRHLILVTADTLRADHLGAYGDTRGLTPHLDALAAQSVRFERAYAPAPLTLPSVAGLLTGRHPEALGVRSNTSRLPAGATTLAEPFLERGFRTAAVVGNAIVRQKTGLAAGFEVFDIEFMLGREEGDPDPVVLTTDAALRAVSALGDGAERLFLWVHYLDPHGPYVPPPEVRERYLAAERARPDGSRLLEFSPNSRGVGAIPRYQSQAPHREVAWYRAGYAGEVFGMDAEVGRLLGELDRRGILGQAVVVFAADHGESLGEADYWFGHGENLDEPSVRVPLLIRVPGRPPEVRPEPVSLLDVAPTLAALFGVALPESAQGVDLLERRAEPSRSLLLATGPAGSYRPGVALVTSEWKLVRRRGPAGAEELLYRLPDETTDVRDEFDDVARRLGADLDARQRARRP